MFMVPLFTHLVPKRLLLNPISRRVQSSESQFLFIYSPLYDVNLFPAASRSQAPSDDVDSKPEVKKVRGGAAAKKVRMSGSTPAFVGFSSVHTGTVLIFWYSLCCLINLLSVCPKIYGAYRLGFYSFCRERECREMCSVLSVISIHTTTI